MTEADRAAVWLERLIAELGGRAAGLWRIEGDALRLVAFLGADDLAKEVREGFEAATAVVGLTREELSIVRAVREGRVVVARAAELPPEVGSGYWLRAFGAERSVAVPVGDGVLSVALPAGSNRYGDEVVAERIRAARVGIGRCPDRLPE
ncbi:MAG: hypothetical protein KatS3mg108_2519 [Isosphaeraceae bacterium]|nr:MAG: hypothetical protein KatS3mg108_2519 [Isosphaeraceae bacterium]